MVQNQADGISYFKDAHNFAIHNRVFTDGGSERSDGSDGIKRLHSEIAVEAVYDSGERFSPPKAHPGTRRAIIDEIRSWIADENKNSRILWLYGPPGSGKSTIAQTVAELCAVNDQLAASFFFSRHAAILNNHDRLFSTIAYQLAVKFTPAVRSGVGNAVENNPSIVHASMIMQVQKLIVEPFQNIQSQAEIDNLRNKVIIIDGLDECANENMQCSILFTIKDLVTRNRFPIPFIICSRPEIWLREGFAVFEDLCRCLTFNDSAQADDDIRQYLLHGFYDINSKREGYELYSMEASEWPSMEDVDHLVKKSSGQFLYAATVLKYIGDAWCDPVDRLEDILRAPGSPMESASTKLD